jgi:hypothetical protein
MEYQDSKRKIKISAKFIIAISTGVGLITKAIMMIH